MPSARITASVVDSAAAKGATWFIWDRDLKGFGVKISPAGKKTYVAQYRVGGGRTGPTRRLTIGDHGSPWTADQARTQAKKILGAAAVGDDPAREKQEARRGLTVADLCALYLAQGCGAKKPSTILTDRGRIERHILPLLGKRKVKDVTPADVKKFLQDVATGKTCADIKTGKHGRAIVRGGKGTATRTVGLLGGIFAFAVDLGAIQTNPVRGVRRFPDRKGERYLSTSEMVALGDALRAASAESANTSALAILRLLALTGARKGEIEALRWDEVELSNRLLRLADSKTGQKTILLNEAATAIIRSMPRLDGSPFVFPADRGQGHYVGTSKVWQRIRMSAGLPDVRLHDLRHSFASVAVSSGASLPIIGALLGHADGATTQRYAHLSDDPKRAVNESVGREIDAALNRDS